MLDAIPKDDMASMEHPIFSLSTRPDRRILTYEHNDTKVEITPSVKGLATIHDKDVMISVSVTLSDWMYRAVMAKSVLTLHRGYFRLRKPLERRVYEIARKHCGAQTSWKISLELLLKKCGSNSPKRVFKQMIKVLIEHDHLPDYTVSLDGDLVVFRNRDRLIERQGVVLPKLDPDIMNDVRIVAPGVDPYALEAAWHEMWIDTGCPKLHDPNAAFLAFCRRRAERAGNG